MPGPAIGPLQPLLASRKLSLTLCDCSYVLSLHWLRRSRITLNSPGGTGGLSGALLHQLLTLGSVSLLTEPLRARSPGPVSKETLHAGKFESLIDIHSKATLRNSEPPFWHAPEVVPRHGKRMPTRCSDAALALDAVLNTITRLPFGQRQGRT